MMLPKAPRIELPRHIEAIKQRPCFVTHRMASDYEAVDPAHVRSLTMAGMGRKPHDMFVVPLIHSGHERQHQMGERAYWMERLSQNSTLAMEAIAGYSLIEFFMGNFGARTILEAGLVMAEMAE